MRGELAWSEMMVEWVLIESLAMVQVVAPFRDCVFFGLWGCFRV